MEERTMNYTKVNIAWWIISAAACSLSIAFVLLSYPIRQAFTSHSNLYSILSTIGIYLLLATAFVLPWSLGHWNCAQLGIGSISAMVAALLVKNAVPGITALFIALVCGTTLGLIIGLLSSLVGKRYKLAGLIFSFLLGSLLLLLATIISGGKPITLMSKSLPGKERFLDFIPSSFIIAIMLVIPLAFLFAKPREKKVSIGRSILSFLLSGLLSALAAYLLCVRVYAYQSFDFSYSGFAPELIMILALSGAGLAFLEGAPKGTRIQCFLRLILASSAYALFTNLMMHVDLNNDYYRYMLLSYALVLVLLSVLIKPKAVSVQPSYAAPSKHTAPPSTNAAPSASDPYAALEKLETLRSQGALSEEEYNQMKADILSLM